MKLNHYMVPEYELSVATATTFASKDLSGETSSTNDGHTGIKATVIDVTFIVKYEQEALLNEFYAIARAVDDNNDLIIYNIHDKTVNAINVRQVKFSGTLRTKKIDELDAWRVSFSLSEYLSVPEKKEQRNGVISSTTTTANGITDDTGEGELTSFEKVLAVADRALE